ncbi:MAG TPA: thioredoxin domain-containing protein [Candidatus Saccharimonadales bacterium]|nr:thioredoxin domain-containing protein [Candidatus Saccharimonadales bacterium]
MSKSFWAVIAVIVVVFGGILFISGHKAAAPGSNGASVTKHLEGSNKTGVLLQEYGDYQCPFCGEYYPVVKAVAQKYNDQIQFQFSNLPLIQIHQNAMAAAHAAEAAGLQGKFWEMHDLLYANQTTWSESSSAASFFDQFATSLGLNLTQFKSDEASDKVNNTINADVDAFMKTGNQESTPTFFLDGKKINPAFDATKSVDQNVALFSTYIDAEIAKKTKQ